MRRTIAIAPVALCLCSCYDWSQTREDARHDPHRDADDAPVDDGPDHEEDAPTDAPCADPDRDDDGWPDRECGGGDCNDLDPTVWPGAPDNAGRWTVEVVQADAWGASRIVLADSDLPHFLFYDDGAWTMGLFHRWNEGTGWWTEEVLERTMSSNAAGVTIGPGDILHAALRVRADREWTDEFLHATRSRDGAWTVAPIPVADPGRVHGTAVAVDARGRVHVGYVDQPRGDDATLRVITNDGGTWTTSTVAVRPESGLGIALAHAPDGTLHAAWTCWSAGAGELIHAVREPDGTAWRVETLTTDLLAADPSLAIDPAGHAHLFAASSAGTPYASDAAGAWTFEAIEPAAADAGAVAVGPDGTPVAVYAVLGWDLSDVLRFARRATAGWRVEELPGTLGVDRDSASVAVDSSGRSHVLFRRGGDIIYAVENPVVLPDGIDQDCDGVDG